MLWLTLDKQEAIQIDSYDTAFAAVKIAQPNEWSLKTANIYYHVEKQRDKRMWHLYAQRWSNHPSQGCMTISATVPEDKVIPKIYDWIGFMRKLNG